MRKIIKFLLENKREILIWLNLNHNIVENLPWNFVLMSNLLSVTTKLNRISQTWRYFFIGWYDSFFTFASFRPLNLEENQNGGIINQFNYFHIRREILSRVFKPFSSLALSKKKKITNHWRHCFSVQVPLFIDMTFKPKIIQQSKEAELNNTDDLDVIKIVLFRTPPPKL